MTLSETTIQAALAALQVMREHGIHDVGRADVLDNAITELGYRYSEELMLDKGWDIAREHALDEQFNDESYGNPDYCEV